MAGEAVWLVLYECVLKIAVRQKMSVTTAEILINRDIEA